ncbi:MAG: helix-turn-helix domain-containing protein [Rhodobacteraceae bacterium]|nr:helix-turn-helix domain-containing protein [Paracoccaceae bacterium]
MCGSLEKDELESLTKIVRCETFGAGEALFREGDSSAWVFNVTDGAIRLSNMLGNGKRQVVGFLFPGDFLGFTGADEYKVTAEAVRGAKVCRFARSELTRLRHQLPQLEHRLFEMAESDLVAAQEHITILGQKSATEKMVAFLLMLSRKSAARGGVDNPVHLPMTREDIADFLGLAFETVSRCLTKLEDQKLITIESTRVIRLNDFAALEDYCEEA